MLEKRRLGVKVILLDANSLTSETNYIFIYILMFFQYNDCLYL